MWLYFKRRFKNSCFYHYTQASLAKAVGVSRTMVRKYVSLFLTHGWCYMHGKNLMFAKHTQLPDRHKKRKCLLLINQHVKEHSIQGYLSAFEAFLIKDAQRKQQHARLKPYGKDMQIRLATRETLQGLPFTVKRASNLLKVSTSTACRKFKKLALQGWFNRVSFPIQKAIFQINPIRGGMEDVTGKNTRSYTLTSYKGYMFKCFPAIINWLPEVVGIRGCVVRSGIVTTNN